MGGRDRPKDEYGIPHCDVEQHSILVGGNEDFGSLSSHGANFNEHYYVLGDDDRSCGTVSVGLFPANGFGLLDMHGQAWEWSQNEVESEEREVKEVFASAVRERSLLGGCRYEMTELPA